MVRGDWRPSRARANRMCTAYTPVRSYREDYNPGIMSASDVVKRFESPRELRSFFALGLVFIAMELWIAARMIGGEYAERYAYEPISAQLVAVALFALMFVLSVMVVMMYLRRSRYILEIGESGIRNPNRHDEWLPWDRISSFRLRPTLQRVEATGVDKDQSVWIGVELGIVNSSLADAITEIALRAPKLCTRQSGKPVFRAWVLPEIAGMLMLTAIGYAGLGWPLALGGAAWGTLVLAATPTRLAVKRDSVHISYLFGTTQVAFDEIDSIELGAYSVVIRRRNGQDSIRVRLGRNALSAFFAIQRALEAAS